MSSSPAAATLPLNWINFSCSPPPKPRQRTSLPSISITPLAHLIPIAGHVSEPRLRPSAYLKSSRAQSVNIGSMRKNILKGRVCCNTIGNGGGGSIQDLEFFGDFSSGNNSFVEERVENDHDEEEKEEVLNSDSDGSIEEEVEDVLVEEDDYDLDIFDFYAEPEVDSIMEAPVQQDSPDNSLKISIRRTFLGTNIVNSNQITSKKRPTGFCPPSSFTLTLTSTPPPSVPSFKITIPSAIESIQLFGLSPYIDSPESGFSMEAVDDSHFDGEMNDFDQEKVDLREALHRFSLFSSESFSSPTTCCSSPTKKTITAIFSPLPPPRSMTPFLDREDSGSSMYSDYTLSELLVSSPPIQLLVRQEVIDQAPETAQPEDIDFMEPKSSPSRAKRWTKTLSRSVSQRFSNVSSSTSSLQSSPTHIVPPPIPTLSSAWFELPSKLRKKVSIGEGLRQSIGSKARKSTAMIQRKP